MRLLDEPDNLCERRFGAHFGRLEFQHTQLVERRANDHVARPLFDRQALSGQHRLIYRQTSRDDDAIDRDLFARAHDDHVAHAHRIDGHVLLDTSARDPRSLRAQAHQLLDCLGRAALGTRFQELAEYDEGDDNGGRLEISVAYAQTEGNQQAVEKRHRRAQRHQHIHVGRAVAQRFEAVDVKLPADVELHRQAQGKQQPVQPLEARVQVQEIRRHADDE